MKIDKLTTLIKKSNFALLDTDVYKTPSKINWFKEIMNKSRFYQLNYKALNEAIQNLEALKIFYLLNNTYTVPFVVEQTKFMASCLQDIYKVIRKNTEKGVKKSSTQSQNKSEYRREKLKEIVGLSNAILTYSTQSLYDPTRFKQYKTIFNLCKKNEDKLTELDSHLMTKGKLEDEFPADAQLASTVIIRAHLNLETDLFTPDLKLINIITSTIKDLQSNNSGICRKGKYSNITYHGIINISKIYPIKLFQENIKLFKATNIY